MAVVETLTVRVSRRRALAARIAVEPVSWLYAARLIGDERADRIVRDLASWVAASMRVVR